MNYRQLSLDERYQLQTLLRQGFSKSAIARTLHRHPSTMSRELKRNAPWKYAAYAAFTADREARKRRVLKGLRSQKIRGRLRVLIESKLRLSWSPEQIAGRLWLERGIRISHETIYQHVLRDTRRNGFLRYCLRFGGYKHHRFKKSKVAEQTRQRKHWLRYRCAAANERTELGHWERDCVIGQRDGAALLTLIDRKSRYTRIRRVAKLDTQHVASATLDALKHLPQPVKSLTNDNGREFQKDAPLQKKLGAPIFFTDPSSPWQRGSIENLNGLIRQYVQKGVDVTAMPPWVGTALEDTLNFRPRKTLKYRTPHEIHFSQELPLLSRRLHFGLEYGV
jgi:IS30 family transposase